MAQPRIAEAVAPPVTSTAPPLQFGESSYTRENMENQSVRFTVHPVRTGSGGWFMHLFFAVATGLFLATVSDNPAGLFVGAPVALILMRAVRNASVTAQRNAGGSFIVDGSGISWGEFRVARPDISGYTIAPAYEHRLNESVARSWKVQKLQATSWQLILEFSGRSTVLAGGMTETTANGLMRDVKGTLESI